MKYLLLLYDDAEEIATLSADQRRSMVEDHIAYAAMLRERGAYVHGDPLDEPGTARLIRFDTPKPTVTDGPFLESKEALGGFYVVDVGSADEAIELASRIPRSPGLVVEVRPIPTV